MNVVGASLNPGSFERRQHLRVQVAVPAEIRPDGSPTTLRAQTRDLSLGGCYLEMPFTLEVGRRLDIVLRINAHHVPVRGIVVTRQPQLGNGINFIGMAAENLFACRTSCRR